MKYLVTINIPYAVGRDGIAYTDPLWAKDLERHAEHVGELVVAAPLATGAPNPDWVAVPAQRADAPRAPIAFVPVPRFSSLFEAWLHRARLRRALEPAIRTADVVQTNVAGWPLPLGWIAGPLARRHGKPTVLVVESAPWRSAAGVKRPTRWLFEHLARREAQSSDMGFFTHSGYRDQLLKLEQPGPRALYVVQASWIDEDFLIDRTRLEKRADERKTQPVLRVLYAGRLSNEKGLRTLIDAAELLRRSTSIEFTFIGSGALTSALAALAEQAPQRFKLLSPVPYGPPFLEVLDSGDCLVVPTVSDEQPRVIYDAFARGLPVIASDTAGNRECVQHNRTGWLFPAGNAVALSERLNMLAANRELLAEASLAALQYASQHTHRKMHAARHSAVSAVLAGGTKPPRANQHGAPRTNQSPRFGRRPLRIMYAEGPGDIVSSHLSWKADEDLLSETAQTYSSQFFEFCRRNGHAGYAVSSNPRRALSRHGTLSVENRPKVEGRGPLRYHYSQIRHGLSLLRTARRWRADAIIADSGVTHWPLLVLFK